MALGEFDNPRKVTIKQSRWELTIVVVDKNGVEYTLIASADSGLTQNDGIWVGTPEEKERGLDW